MRGGSRELSCEQRGAHPGHGGLRGEGKALGLVRPPGSAGRPAQAAAAPATASSGRGDTARGAWHPQGRLPQECRERCHVAVPGVRAAVMDDAEA